MSSMMARIEREQNRMIRTVAPKLKDDTKRDQRQDDKPVAGLPSNIKRVYHF
jgi:hypothetical protein